MIPNPFAFATVTLPDGTRAELSWRDVVRLLSTLQREGYGCVVGTVRVVSEGRP